MSNYIKYIRNLVGHSKVIMAVSGVFILDSENRLLLQLRSDNNTWGHPGGFMEIGETVEETAKREAYEETGLVLKDLELFGIYSGTKHENTLPNGDEVALIKIIFTCRHYEGELNSNNDETITLKYFDLENIPKNIFQTQKYEFNDLLSGKIPPFIR